ncbi:MAG: SDR family oxidoreductase [Clostridia bacterium]|nr:SDR family oxidoreductase [Clostridia bacterium]
MKSVFVTGATGGIGESICKKFAEEGYFVGIHYNKNEEKARELEKNLGGFAACFDLSDKTSAVNAVNEFAKRAGGEITSLVNNAGIALPVKPFVDVTDDEINMAISVNLTGMMTVTKAALGYMVGGSSIVNVSSMWGITGGSCEVVYSATKAGVIGFTKALAKEYALSGIRVNAVAPGFIDTEMNANLSESDREIAIGDIPLGRVGKPEEVAESVFFLAEKATFTTGAVLDVSGGEVI